jgi:hypothetical protein
VVAVSSPGTVDSGLELSAAERDTQQPDSEIFPHHHRTFSMAHIFEQESRLHAQRAY